jgi:hypothetical protein
VGFLENEIPGNSKSAWLRNARCTDLPDGALQKSRSGKLQPASRPRDFPGEGRSMKVAMLDR